MSVYEPPEPTVPRRRTQVFHPFTNTLSRLTIFGGVFIVAALSLVGARLYTSYYQTGVNVPVVQPIPFSHEHHVQQLGLDCRYCHTSVETSSFAGIPPTETCMTCHSQIWNTSPMLAPVRASFQTGVPIQWNRVHNLPDFVYFNHSIHVNKGIGCSSCHGRVDEMPLTYKVTSLSMNWCVGCHRDPSPAVRPLDQVFNMNWVAPADQKTKGAELIKQYHIDVGRITNCSTCHR